MRNKFEKSSFYKGPFVSVCFCLGSIKSLSLVVITSDIKMYLLWIQHPTTAISNKIIHNACFIAEKMDYYPCQSPSKQVTLFSSNLLKGSSYCWTKSNTKIVTDFKSWNVFTMSLLIILENSVFQIMQFIGYAKQLKKLDNVVYLCSLVFQLIIYHSHLFHSIILMMLNLYWLKSICVYLLVTTCCFIVPLFPNLSVQWKMRSTRLFAQAGFPGNWLKFGLPMSV